MWTWIKSNAKAGGSLLVVAIGSFVLLSLMTDYTKGTIAGYVFLLTLVGVVWVSAGKNRGPMIGLAVACLVLLFLNDHYRKEHLQKWRSQVGQLVQDVSAVTSEPLPKKVVVKEFVAGEKIRTGVRMTKDQDILIETTAPVKMPCSQEPSGFREIPNSMLQTCLADGQLILVAGDKPGKVTITFY